MSLAAILLAGGGSRRMGRSKALMDWHGVPLLHRTAALLGRIAAPVVVVHAIGQELPPLPADVRRVADRRPAEGPLEGIAAGLDELDGVADLVAVAAADLPFLHPALLTGLTARIGERGAAVAVADGRPHPLAAVYRAAVAAPAAHELLEGGERRARMLAERCDALLVDAAELAAPGSLRNVNTAEEYAAALAEPPPLVIAAGRELRAATLGDALGAAPGLRGARVLLNGLPVDADPWTPLVDGDVLALG